MWKREWIAAVLALMLALSGCTPLVEDSPEALTVCATFYPIYALTEPLTEGVPDLTLRCLVQPQDGCLRSYSLSDWDLYLLSSADAVIAGGRGLESFESMLFAMGDKGPAVSTLLYNLELQNSTRERHDTSEEDSHLNGPNPHLYMSVDGAKRIVESAAAMLQTLDPRFAQTYVDNEERAMERLDALEAQMDEIAGNLNGRRAILMNETLVYFARDFGLEIAGQVDRESGEGLYDVELEETLEQMAGYDAGVVLIERQAPRALVEALEAHGYSVGLIDILSTHRASDGFEGYIQAQINNARAIRRAFDGEATH